MADTNPRERINNEISSPPTRRAVGPVNALDLEAALLGLPGNVKLPETQVSNAANMSSNNKVALRYIPPAFYLVNQLMKSEPAVESSEVREKIPPPPPLKPI